MAQRQKRTAAGGLFALRAAIRATLQTAITAKNAALVTAGRSYTIPTTIADASIRIRRKLKHAREAELPLVQIRWQRRRLLMPSDGYHQGDANNYVEVVYYLANASPSDDDGLDRDEVLDLQTLDFGDAILAGLKTANGTYAYAAYGLSGFEEVDFRVYNVNTDLQGDRCYSAKGVITLQIPQSVEYT